MKKQTFTIAVILLMLTTFSSCEIIGGIFKAGVGVGIFLVLIVVAIVIFAISKMGNNK